VDPVGTTAERVRVMLESVMPARLTLVPDCSFSQTPRVPAFPKLRNLVLAAEQVRKELTA
jgi:methionine synthase II (cobalamin-independent)